MVEEKFSARTKPTPARVMVCSAFGKDGMATSVVAMWFSQVVGCSKVMKLLMKENRHREEIFFGLVPYHPPPFTYSLLFKVRP